MSEDQEVDPGVPAHLVDHMTIIRGRAEGRRLGYHNIPYGFLEVIARLDVISSRLATLEANATSERVRAPDKPQTANTKK